VSGKVHGYGADAELEGTTLRLTATGKIGHGALGTDARDIVVPEVKALSFAPGNALKNGRLELVDGRGKSIVHFRRKSNAEFRSLYEQLVELAPAGAAEVPTGDAPLFSEDFQNSALNVWLTQKGAEAESRKAAKLADKEGDAANEARKGAEVQTGSAPSPTAATSDAADQIRKLAQLHDEGLITDEEFNAKRTELLARM
jgi:hypothetical protein